MKKVNKIPATIDEYIISFPLEVQKLLMELRIAVKEAAPLAEEKISYRMPSFKYKGMLVYFAAYKNHIGFYPLAAGIEAFKDKIMKYNTSKGTVQFPLDKPLPVKLIKQIVKFRVKENLKKGSGKTKKTGK